MPLEVITGRAVTGKTGHVHRRVVEAALGGRSTVLLLPTQPDVTRAREELAGRVPVGVEVSTWAGWIEHQWFLHGDGRRLATDAERQAIAEEILVAGGGSASSVAYTTKTRNAFSAVIATAATRQPAQGTSDIDKALAQAAAKYSGALRSRGLIDTPSAQRCLAECPAITGYTIAVNRFTDLEQEQAHLLVSLGRRNDVLLALTWEDGFAATEALDSLVSGPLSEAQHLHLPAPEPCSELQRLEAYIFNPTTPLSSQGEVVLCEAAGDEAECAVIAQALRDLVDDGVRPENIAVTFRDVGKRAQLLASAVRSQAIDVEMDYLVGLGSTPFGAALRALLGVAQGAAGAEKMMDFLRSPFSGMSASDSEMLDARYRRGRIENPAVVLYEAEKRGGSPARIIGRARAIASTTLVGDGLKAWSELLDEMLDNGLSREEPWHEQRLDAAARSAVVDALNAFTREPSLSTTNAFFINSLEEVRVSAGVGERPGAVYVTEAHRLRARRFDVVVLGGLTADEFSSEHHESLESLLLRRLGLLPAGDRRLSERMLFYSVVTRARNKLVLVRQSADAAGSERRPSLFWEEIVDLYRTPEQAAAGEDGTLSVAATLGLGDLVHSAPAMNVGRRDLRASVGKSLRRPTPSARGRLSGRDALAAQDTEFSVTELETYLACPYRWFYERIIRPRELDTAFEGAERGSLSHEFLASFYTRLHEEDIARVEPHTIETCLELFERTANQVQSGHRLRTRGLQEEILASEARAWARQAVLQDATLFEDFVPVHHEWEFGRGAQRPFALNGVRLRGKIDRIDLGAEGIIVTDYKSSKSVAGQADFEKKGLLQAVVYAMAAKEHHEVELVGTLYRSLRTGALRGMWQGDGVEEEQVVRKDHVDGERAQALTDWAASQVMSAADRIRQGDIPASPARPDACMWCSASDFCSGACE